MAHARSKEGAVGNPRPLPTAWEVGRRVGSRWLCGSLAVLRYEVNRQLAPDFCFQPQGGLGGIQVSCTPLNRDLPALNFLAEVQR